MFGDFTSQSRIVTRSSSSQAECLSVHDPRPASHTLIRVDAIEAPEEVRALGTYLVGIIAGVVAIDLSISERYLASVDRRSWAFYFAGVGSQGSLRGCQRRHRIESEPTRSPIGGLGAAALLARGTTATSGQSRKLA